MTSPLDLFFHSSHRIGRMAFFLGTVLLLSLRAAVDFGLDQGMPQIAGVIACAALGYSALCLLSLRLHDRGRSGWWGWLILLAFVVAWPLTRGANENAANLMACGVLIIVAVDLLVMPGQKRFNRYGRPPHTNKSGD